MNSTGTLLAVVVATGMTLAGCGTGSTDAAAPAASTAPVATSTSAPTNRAPDVTTTTASEEQSSVGRCTSADLTPSLGAVPAPGGQITVPFRCTNSGTTACTLVGYPGATLQGPDHPQHGPQYQLARASTADPTTITLAPGQAAVAELTLGTVATTDPSGWQPTELLTIAPGDTTVMRVPFPAGTPVSRQDAATHPATYVGVFTGPVS